MFIPYRNPRLTPEQKTDIISDYLAGFHYEEIAKRNKTSIPTAKRIVAMARKTYKPDKDIARRKVQNAVRKGKIKKLPCLICGELKVDAHHTDYAKPLEVVWYCKKHHAFAHGNYYYADGSHELYNGRVIHKVNCGCEQWEKKKKEFNK